MPWAAAAYAPILPDHGASRTPVQAPSRKGHETPFPATGTRPPQDLSQPCSDSVYVRHCSRSLRHRRGDGGRRGSSRSLLVRRWWCWQPASRRWWSGEQPNTRRRRDASGSTWTSSPTSRPSTSMHAGSARRKRTYRPTRGRVTSPRIDPAIRFLHLGRAEPRLAQQYAQRVGDRRRERQGRDSEGDSDRHLAASCAST